MRTMQIQTVHGVSSTIIRGLRQKQAASSEEASAASPPRTIQRYRKETAKRLKEATKVALSKIASKSSNE